MTTACRRPWAGQSKHSRDRRWSRERSGWEVQAMVDEVSPENTESIPFPTTTHDEFNRDRRCTEMTAMTLDMKGMKPCLADDETRRL